MIKKIISCLLVTVVIANLCCCSGAPAAAVDPTVIEGYGEPVKTDNAYAECFTIYEYNNGDAMITTNDGKAYFVIERNDGYRLSGQRVFRKKLRKKITVSGPGWLPGKK